MEKSKKNIHPWQRRTMGESFSGDTLLEYGGVECGEKGGRVAWKDPEDIKQEPCTTGRRQVMASTCLLLFNNIYM